MTDLKTILDTIIDECRGGNCCPECGFNEDFLRAIITQQFTELVNEIPCGKIIFQPVGGISNIEYTRTEEIKAFKKQFLNQ